MFSKTETCSGSGLGCVKTHANLQIPATTMQADVLTGFIEDSIKKKIRIARYVVLCVRVIEYAIWATSTETAIACTNKALQRPCIKFAELHFQQKNIY